MRRDDAVVTMPNDDFVELPKLICLDQMLLSALFRFIHSLIILILLHVNQFLIYVSSNLKQTRALTIVSFVFVMSKAHFTGISKGIQLKSIFPCAWNNLTINYCNNYIFKWNAKSILNGSDVKNKISLILMVHKFLMTLNTSWCQRNLGFNALVVVWLHYYY